MTPAESVPDPITVIEPRITACSARLQNPRKLSLKSTVMTDVKLSKIMATSPVCEPDAKL